MSGLWNRSAAEPGLDKPTAGLAPERVAGLDVEAGTRGKTCYGLWSEPGRGYIMKHSNGSTFDGSGAGFPNPQQMDPERQFERTRAVMDRWVAEQLFEEDVRSMLLMLRPNKHERLLGWKEYRTGGANFRVTVSWDEASQKKLEDQHPDQQTAMSRRDRAMGIPAERSRELAVPNMADVIETLLVGSMKHDDDVSAREEFEAYRQVLLEVRRRLDEMQSCYE